MVEVLYVPCDWTVDGISVSFSAAGYSFLFEEVHVMACDDVQGCIVGLGSQALVLVSEPVLDQDGWHTV